MIKDIIRKIFGVKVVLSDESIFKIFENFEKGDEEIYMGIREFLDGDNCMISCENKKTVNDIKMSNVLSVSGKTFAEAVKKFEEAMILKRMACNRKSK